MYVLVTGGAGFIGSHLCKKLLVASRMHVIAVDNFDPFYAEQRKRQNLRDLQQYARFHFHSIDVRSPKAMKKLFEMFPITHVVHLAGRGGVPQSLKYPFLYIDENVRGTLSVLEAAKKRLSGHFINASSSSVYGEIGTDVCSEGNRTDLPSSVYAASKKATELLCRSYSSMYVMSVINVRFFSVYGPRGRPDQVIYRLTRMIDTGKTIPWVIPEPQRDFTYIDDVTDGLAKLLRVNGRQAVDINLGYGKPQTIGTVIREIEKSLGKRAMIGKTVHRESYDLSASHADTSLARKAIGWEPRVDLSLGISRFVKWYQMNEPN